MSFSTAWDERYRANTQLSVWPWSDLVSYVMRYARPSGRETAVLELGCGAGANIPFFKELGVRYYAVEGSPAIVERLRERFPDLKDNIVVGDFTQEIPLEGRFDLVADRSSLTHNSDSAIRNCLSLLRARLKEGGSYIGIDWFSTAHSDFRAGKAAEDPYTRRDFESGQFAKVGRVHFSDRAHLEDLFKGFSIETLEHKIVERKIPDVAHVFASWNLVARLRHGGS
jgi:SAM-dependent methyltransferase